MLYSTVPAGFIELVWLNEEAFHVCQNLRKCARSVDTRILGKSELLDQAVVATPDHVSDPIDFLPAYKVAKWRCFHQLQNFGIGLFVREIVADGVGVLAWASFALVTAFDHEAHVTGVASVESSCLVRR